MTPRSKKWFDDAIRKGVDTKVAYFGAEIIDSWAKFWGYEILDDNVQKMIDFALVAPEAALDRWSILGLPWDMKTP